VSRVLYANDQYAIGVQICRVGKLSLRSRGGSPTRRKTTLTNVVICRPTACIVYRSLSLSIAVYRSQRDNLNGRRETLTIGRYGLGGITLAQACDRCVSRAQARDQGCSPAL